MKFSGKGTERLVRTQKTPPGMTKTKEKNRMPHRSVVGRLNLQLVPNYNEPTFISAGTLYTGILPKRKSRGKMERKNSLPLTDNFQAVFTTQNQEPPSRKIPIEKALISRCK